MPFLPGFPRLRDMQPDWRFKCSSVVACLRSANMQVKKWPRKDGLRFRLFKEANTLNTMLCHMWRDFKLRAPWMKSWGLWSETPPEQVNTVVPALTLRCSIAASLPAWMLADIRLSVATGAVSSAMPATTVVATLAAHPAPVALPRVAPAMAVAPAATPAAAVPADVAINPSPTRRRAKDKVGAAMSFKT